MWPFVWFLVLIVPGDALSPCESQVIFLNESWSSWHLLPPKNFSLDVACSYTLVYPSDTALCGQFHPVEQWKSQYEEVIGGMDAFGSVVSLTDYRVMTCLPPPWYSVFLPSRVVSGSLANDYALLSMDSYCGSNNCTKFHLKKVDAFKNNKTILVTSGMKPFIIVANNATGGNITYNFTGDPKLSAVYIKGSNKYNTYERTPLDGESFFLYNEMGQIMGTPASWQSSVRQFSQLIVYEMTPGPPATYADPPGLLLVLSSEDLEGLVHPKFIQPSYYMVPTIDASHGETSITIVDADSYSNYCLQYFLGYFTFSDDIDIIIHDGFPTQNVTEDMIVHRLNATTMAPDYVMMLGCTKTMRVLQGNISFYINKISAYIIRQNRVKGFIKPEKKALKNPGNQQKVELDFPCNIYKCNFTAEITWQDGSPTDSKLMVDKFQPQYFYPPNPVEIDHTDKYMLTLGLSKGAIHFDITESDSI